MLTLRTSRLITALFVILLIAGGAILADEGGDADAGLDPVERVETLRARALSSLPEIDARIEGALERARAACETPWAGARLNKAVDPYSLALHQEGRSRRDQTAAAMRSTQKGVAYFRLLNTKQLGRWDKLAQDLDLARTRLVESLRDLEELSEPLSSESPSRRTRESVGSELGEMWSALRAMEGGVERARDLLAEHREEWSELASQAREADPEGLELQARTREKGERMLSEFLAMDESFSALAGASEKHLDTLLASTAPLLEELSELRRIFKPSRRDR